MHTRRRALAATLLTATLCGAAVVSERPSSPGPVDVARPVAAEVTAPRVLLVSIDGLNPNALRKLGERGTPELHRLVAEGASTLNARSAVEQTETLPNHIGMVTGRRIDRRHRGHGVTWNDDRRRPITVHRAARHRVASIFSLARTHRLDTALFSAKRKFRLMTRSWVEGLDLTVIDRNNRRLVRKTRRDLVAGEHHVTMLHLSLPDVTGHRDGFMTRPYLESVATVDTLLGTVMEVVRADVAAGGRTWVVLTADHGGSAGAHRHGDARVLAHARVPFVVWGPDVASGADLYDLSPGLKDPRRRIPGYAGPQPVRNAAAANVVAELLGLPVVPGSVINADRALRFR